MRRLPRRGPAFYHTVRKRDPPTKKLVQVKLELTGNEKLQQGLATGGEGTNGEGGIRTRGRGLIPYNGLANRFTRSETPEKTGIPALWPTKWPTLNPQTESSGPEVLAVIEQLSTLPEPVRTTIVALVNALSVVLPDERPERDASPSTGSEGMQSGIKSMVQALSEWIE